MGQISRNFIVLFLSQKSRREMEKFSSLLAKRYSGVFNSQKDELHFTILSFVSDTEKYSAIIENLNRAIAGFAPLKISFDGIWAYFSSRNECWGLMWIIKKTAPLRQMRSKITEAIDLKNIDVEHPDFDEWLPHICAVDKVKKIGDNFVGTDKSRTLRFQRPLGNFEITEFTLSKMVSRNEFSTITKWKL